MTGGGVIPEAVVVVLEMLSSPKTIAVHREITRPVNERLTIMVTGIKSIPHLVRIAKSHGAMERGKKPEIRERSMIWTGPHLAVEIRASEIQQDATMNQSRQSHRAQQTPHRLTHTEMSKVDH